MIRQLPNRFDEEYRASLHEQAAALEHAVMRGDAVDYAAYKFFVGQYLGLQVALNRFNDLIKNYEVSDE